MECRKGRGRTGLGYEREDVVRIRRQPMLCGLREGSHRIGRRYDLLMFDERANCGVGIFAQPLDERAQGARWQIRERRDRRAPDRQRLGAVEGETGENVQHV